MGFDFTGEGIAYQGPFDHWSTQWRWKNSAKENEENI